MKNVKFLTHTDTLGERFQNTAEIIVVEFSMVKIHSVVKFWARKTPSIIESLIPSGAKSLLDPFCGSGTSGYVGVLKKIKRIMLSDINPVAIFITHTLLNKTVLDDDVYVKVRELCKSVEKEAYTFTYNGKKYVVEKAAWVTKYACPYCGEIVDPRTSRRTRLKTLVCQRCNKRFLPVEAKQLYDEVFEIHVYDEGGRKLTIKDPKLLKVYAEESENFKATAWFPDGEFTYPDGKPFNQHPYRIKRVSELFTERGLFAASTLYQFIEDFWLKDREQGDLLKLAFISSVVAATKMLPYTRTSGTSWKLPRYWIPHVRYEKNFCRTFIRKLSILYKFKKEWFKHVADYSIRVSYDLNSTFDLTDYSINIVRADARELNVNTSFDLILMDPPHFSEINYYELTYLWQLWLRGRYNDERFMDFSYWKNEIDINLRVGRDLTHYIEEIARTISKYARVLSSNGKLFLILHNSDLRILNETIRRIKEYVGSIQHQEIMVRVPSSAQGIHGKRKRKLYLLTIIN